MRRAMRRLCVLMAVLAPITSSADRATAGLIFSSIRESGPQSGYLGPTIAYTFDSAHGPATGAKSNAAGGVSLSSVGSGTAIGLSVDLRSRAEAFADVAARGYDATSSYFAFAVNFRVDETAIYNVTLQAASTATATGGGRSGAQNYLSLFDTYGAGPGVERYRYLTTKVGQGSRLDSTLPDRVVFLVGHTYSLQGSANTWSSVESFRGRIAGRAEASASFKAELTPAVAIAAPEPSTIISCGMAGLIGLGLAARRRRRAKLAA